MKLSSYVYPWDLANAGIGPAFDEFEQLGLDSIDLTSNYHPIASFSPRPGRWRTMYTEQGALFFEPNRARYGVIEPTVWPDRELTGVWPQAIDEARRRGIAVNSWTIAMFQPWAAHQCPEAARTLATGERVFATLCPAAAPTRELIAALACDLVDQFDVEMVQLEGATYLGATYGWVRPRFLTPVSPFASWLMSLCFCAACTSAMAAAGLAAEPTRRLVLDLLDREFAEPTEDARDWPATIDGPTARHPELLALMEMRAAVTVDLVREVADAVNGLGVGHRLSIWGPVDGDGSPSASLEQVVDRLGGLQVMTARGEHAVRARQAADSVPGRRLRVTSLMPSPWDQTPADLDAIADELRECREKGIDRVALYQYGTRTPSEVAAIVERMRSESAQIDKKP